MSVSPQQLNRDSLGLLFSVQVGETSGPLGPNGAGKTTNMRTLAGLCRIISGTLHGGDLDRDLSVRA